MWFAFFMLGGFWWWGLVLIELVLWTAFVENDSGWGAFWSLIGFTALVHLFGDAQWFGWIKDNPMKLLTYGGIYIGVGFLWSMLKLRLKLSPYREKIERVREQYIESGKDVNDDDAWKTFLAQNTDTYDIPTFSKYYDKLAMWWAYWPPSMFWTVCHDLLERMFKEFVRMFKAIYKGIFNATVGAVVGEVREAKDYAEKKRYAD